MASPPRAPLLYAYRVFVKHGKPLRALKDIEGRRITLQNAQRQLGD